MPKDLGTWGFILSVAALILMYPVGLLISFTAPKIETWFASWSRDRLVSRIDTLEERLHHHKLIDLPHPVHAAILRACLLLAGQIGIAVHIGLGVMYFTRPPIISETNLFVLMLLNMGITLAVAMSIRHWLRKYSLHYRAKIAEQLVDAQMRLKKAYFGVDPGK